MDEKEFEEEREIKKEIEEQIENLPMEDFSARWKRIKGRLPMERRRKRIRKYWVAIASSLGAVAVSFTLIFCFVLRPFGEGERYYKSNELLFQSVGKEAFYAGYPGKILPHFEKYEYDLYEFIVTEDGELKGGEVCFNPITDEEFLFTIDFYFSDVTISEDGLAHLKDRMTVNGVEFAYRTEVGDLYESRASATYHAMTYLISYSSLNDDFVTFLGGLFEEKASA